MKLFRGILYPFGLLYGTGVALRNLAYDRGWKKAHVLPVPVVSVGNISVGGTGKTPMAEFLLEHLLAAGARPAYLSRGYGRKTTGFLRVDPKDDRGG
ncbi:MAG: tetraacyldisaccharide 4'-kinase, partial [Bacteroidota bacterium]